MKTIIKLIASLLLCFMGNISYSQAIVEEMQKNYSAQVTDATQIKITNNYGDIDFVTWEKDSIKIEIAIRIESKYKENIEKAKNSLNIAFNSSFSLVSCETNWSGDGVYRSSSFSKKLMANYKVYLPENLELEVSTRFGNIFLENYTGRLTAKVSHGDLRARDLSNIREIEVKYGKLKLNEIGNAKIKLTGVKFAEIKKVNELDLTSTLSEVQIETANELVLNSRNDEITVNKVNICKGKTSLTDLKIDKLTQNLVLQPKFGSLRVKDVLSTVKNIDLESQRTDINLSFNSSTIARLNLEVDDEKYMAYGSGFSEVSKTVGTKDKVLTTLIAGKGEITTKVKIYATKGYVDLSTN